MNYRSLAFIKIEQIIEQVDRVENNLLRSKLHVLLEQLVEIVEKLNQVEEESFV